MMRVAGYVLLLSLLGLGLQARVDADPIGANPVRVVHVSSATPATGPLAPPARVQTARTPADLLAALRRSAPDAGASAGAASAPRRWAAAVERALARAGLPGAPVDVRGSTGRLLEARTGPITKLGGRARFLRVAGDPATVSYDDRFEPFDAGGYYVRKTEGPGERSVRTNVPDDPVQTLVWQVGRVVVEFVHGDPDTAKEIDAAAREVGLYAERLPAGARSELESDDDLPFEGAAPDTRAKPSRDRTPPRTFDIPSLQAHVTGLRFFEGGAQVVPPDRRAYGQRFAREATRYVWWELGLAYAPSDRARSFHAVARWTRPGGSLLVEQALDGRLEARWTSSLHAKGFGQPVPASWMAGTYRVDILIEGRVVASGAFQVTSRAHLSGALLHHDQVDASGQKGVLITFRLETWGRRGQETHVGAYVYFADGTPLKDHDRLYADRNGNVAADLVVHPVYDDALWKQAQIFIPYAQLHLARGTHELRIELVVYDPRTGAPLARAPWLALRVTQG
jgi:hypothetical protein